MAVSILVLTLNEEINIGACLDSVAWSDDIVVLDSHSSDGSVEIARARGARVYQRAFDDYASQRNFALRQINYAHPWLLMLDADERVPDELRREILETTRSVADDQTLFRMRRKDHLFGRWIRGSSGYPTWLGRLGRVGRVWFERAINEEIHTDGRCGYLRAHLDHFPFNKGLSAWISKHDRYSTMEAELLVDGTSGRFRVADLVHRDAAARRRAVKALAYRVPGRPVLVFFTLYLLRGGFLDGRAGITFSLLRAWYEYMIDCKRTEILRRRAGLPL